MQILFFLWVPLYYMFTPEVITRGGSIFFRVSSFPSRNCEILFVYVIPSRDISTNASNALFTISTSDVSHLSSWNHSQSYLVIFAKFRKFGSSAEMKNSLLSLFSNHFQHTKYCCDFRSTRRKQKLTTMADWSLDFESSAKTPSDD